MGLIRKEKGSNSMRVIAGKARRLPLKTIEGLGYPSDYGPDQGDPF